MNTVEETRRRVREDLFGSKIAGLMAITNEEMDAVREDENDDFIPEMDEDEEGQL